MQMLLMSKEDVTTYINEVTRLVANKLNIESFELKNQTELENSIKSKDENISNNLEDFIKNYNAWHNFHVEKLNTDTLSHEEYDSLMTLIKNRNKTREHLINAIQNDQITKALNKNIEEENILDRDLKESSQVARKNKFRHLFKTIYKKIIS